MSESRRVSNAEWSDPDDAPEWTDAMFDAAEFRNGGGVRRAGTASTMASLSRVTPRAIAGKVYAMAKGKVTSPKAASKTLSDGRTSKTSKTAAGLALSQKPSTKKKK